MNSIGAIIVAVFAVVWVAAGTSNFPRSRFAWSLTLSILISAAIVLAVTRVPFGGHIAGFNGRIYGTFVTFEAVAIFCVVVLLNRFGAKEYLIPAIAFIVGLHFFGMVPALQSNEFWWVGGAMCVLSLLTLFILPQNTWRPAVGIGCAVILWLSALGAFF